MRAVPALLLLCCVATAADQDRARHDAWDAYVLGQAADARYVPVLLNQLRRYRSGEDAESWAVRQAILDALIRSKARVPAGEILPLRARHRVPVFALLVSNAEAHPAALLELLGGKPNDFEWAAICNNLAELRSPGLAAHLLAGIDPSLHINVVGGDGIGIGGGAGGAFPGRGSGRVIVPEGWPPRPYYHLSTRGGTNSTLLAGGPKPIYLARAEYPAGRHGRSWRTARVRRRPLRLAYLALLLRRETGDLGVRLDSSAYIVWRDAQQCEREMIAAKADVERSWEELEMRLFEGGLLSKKEAAALPLALRVRVTDCREDRRTALPHLPSGPPPVPQPQ